MKRSTAVMYGPWMGAEEVACSGYQHGDGFLIFAAKNDGYLKMVNLKDRSCRASAFPESPLTDELIASLWDKREIDLGDVKGYLLKDLPLEFGGTYSSNHTNGGYAPSGNPPTMETNLPTAVMHGAWMGVELPCNAYTHSEGFLIFACVEGPHLKMVRAHLEIAKANSRAPDVLTNDSVSEAWDRADIDTIPPGAYMLKQISGLAPLPDGPHTIPNSKLCFQETGTGKLAAIGADFIRWIQAAGVPGGQIAVVQNGDLLLNLATGCQSLESNTPLQVTDRFFTNCSSAAILSMIFMHMVDKGLISLESNPFEVLYGEDFFDTFGEDLDPKWREVTCEKWGFGGRGNPGYGVIPKRKGVQDADHMWLYGADERSRELPGVADLKSHPGTTAYYGEGGDMLLRVMQKLAGDAPFKAPTYTCGPGLARYARENIYAPTMAPFGEVVPFWNIEEGWRNVRVYDGSEGMRWSYELWSNVLHTFNSEPLVLPMACLAALAGGMQHFLSQEAISRMFDSPEPWDPGHPGAHRVYLGWETSMKDTGIASKGGGDADRCFTIVSRTASDAGIAIGISGQPSGTGIESGKMCEFVRELHSVLS